MERKPRMNSNEERSPVQWINQFLAGLYFSICGAHDSRNNDKNNFCIDCETLACHHCISDGTHDDHRVLRIYRLVHMNAVRTDDINTHVDCSGIQTYKRNGRFVLALHPLPHRGTVRYKKNISCRFCRRKLTQPNDYQFCSIACKFQINHEEPTDAESTVKPPAPEDDAGAGAGPSDKISSLRKRSRKGVPIRALPSRSQA